MGLEGEEEVVAFTRPNTYVKVVKLQEFNRSSEKVLDFMMVYRLYIRIRMKKVAVEEQIQWILLYV